MSALFPDHLTSKAEKEIRHHEDKRSARPAPMKPQCFHPYGQASRQQDSDQKSSPPTWKQIKSYPQWQVKEPQGR